MHFEHCSGCRQVIENIGERGRNRTFNLLIKSQLLCQLSYAPARVGTTSEGTSIIASNATYIRPAVSCREEKS